MSGRQFGGQLKIRHRATAKKMPAMLNIKPRRQYQETRTVGPEPSIMTAKETPGFF
jgi:hypothetical protein